MPPPFCLRPSYRPVFQPSRYASGAGGASIDPDVESYAELVGLSASATSRLSAFVATTKSLDIGLVQLIAGKSEFNAPTGAAIGQTVRAVIGNDAEITGGPITEDPEGIGTAAATHMRMANPQKGTGITEFSCLAIGSTNDVTTTGRTLTSGYGGGTSRGPRLALIGAISGDSVRGLGAMSQDGTVGTLSSFNLSFPTTLADAMVPMGLSFDATGGAAKPVMFGGQFHYPDISTISARASLYNDDTYWFPASRTPANPLLGSLALDMQFSKPMSQQDYATILGAAKRNDIADLPDLLATGVGSSITAGAGGTAGREAYMACLHYHSAGANWTTTLWNTNAISGSGADSHTAVLTTEVIPYFNQFGGGFNKICNLEYGRNQPVDEQPYSDTAEKRQVLIDKVLAAAALCVANGITPYVDSFFYALPLATGTAQELAYTELYNDALSSQCAAAGYNFSDHRNMNNDLTPGDYTDFEWPNINVNYPFFNADDVHPTYLGYQKLAEVRRQNFPNP